MILERMTQRQIRTLVLVARAQGRAVRSNYTARTVEATQNGTWPIYWKSLDWLVASGLVIRAGRFYSPTVRGQELAAQARVRKWD